MVKFDKEESIVSNLNTNELRYIRLKKVPTYSKVMYWENIRDNEVIVLKAIGDQIERRFEVENLSHVMWWECHEKEIIKFLNRCEWVELTKKEYTKVLEDKGLM